MKASKVEAFFREFPFLEQHVNADNVGSVKVSRVDRDFLATRRKQEVVMIDFLLPPVMRWMDLLILDKDGNKLIEVGKRDQPWWMLGFGSDFAESIGETLVRLGQKREEAFFVLSFARAGGHLVLCKPPKDFTINAWVEEQIRREQAKLREEMSKIDSEAVTA